VTQTVSTSSANVFAGVIRDYVSATSAFIDIGPATRPASYTSGALSLTGALTVGVDDTGYDVKFYGATSGSYWLWDESADGVVQIGTLTVGVDDAGHDVKFFGATSGSYFLWDESADGIVLVGSMDQTGNSQLTGTLTVGVDDTGHDVKFFGATSGRYVEWDESLFFGGETCERILNFTCVRPSFSANFRSSQM